MPVGGEDRGPGVKRLSAKIALEALERPSPVARCHWADGIPLLGIGKAIDDQVVEWERAETAVEVAAGGWLVATMPRAPKTGWRMAGYGLPG